MPEIWEDSDFYTVILKKEAGWINERREALGRSHIRSVAPQRRDEQQSEPVAPLPPAAVPAPEPSANSLTAENAVRPQNEPATSAQPQPASAGGGQNAPLGPTAKEPEHKSGIQDTIGLALSGGGIRSSAFCLGALQALNAHDVLRYVDYLSTVSGGGFIGSSLSAAMSVQGQREDEKAQKEGRKFAGYTFPFDSRLDQKEPFAVQHVRNFSNYLFPRGNRDLLDSIAIYLRGIAANVIIVLPYLLWFAALTIWIVVDSAVNPKILWLVERPAFLPGYFVISTILAVSLIIAAIIWSVVRSVRAGMSQEVPSSITLAYGLALFVVLLVAFFELQPYLLSGLDAPGVKGPADSSASFQQLLLIFAPLIGVAGLLWRQFKAYVEKEIERVAGRWRGLIVAQVRWLIVICVLPVLLWATYLVLCAWGIPGSESTPEWLAVTADWLAGTTALPVAVLYFWVGAVLFVMSWALSPNANTLHRLYRDRLSKAFLFDPVRPQTTSEQLREKLQERLDSLLRRLGPMMPESLVRWLTPVSESERTKLDRDLPPLENFRLTNLSPRFAPYHILNAALNLQGSKFANRRGRNADFFTFSPQYVGSAATGYVDTTSMQEAVADLSLATALAISGAAASANMGSSGVRGLAPTLALLNVRLGYWLSNPKWVGHRKLVDWLSQLNNLYLLQEIMGRLDEQQSLVYLTDGGHIENLGAYELLKRRCYVIVVIDAEHDPEMNFNSFITLQRYARIDLGARIELPWEPIRERMLQANKEYQDGKVPKQLRGPHCAIGKILYDDDQIGYLIYIKSSFTGDENDYVRDYKRRNPSFPHEGTSDQAFTEEQFEAYRALGFHAVYRMFKGEDAVALHSNLDGKQDFSAGLDKPLETSLLGRWTRGCFSLPPQNQAEEVREMLCEAISAARDAAASAAATEKRRQQPPAPLVRERSSPRRPILRDNSN